MTEESKLFKFKLSDGSTLETNENLYAPYMNKTKHTPGPWNFRMEDTYYIIYESKYETRIGTMNQEVTEDKANARLIAAAPELLEALKQIIINNNLSLVKIDKKLEERVLNAIAKAERQP